MDPYFKEAMDCMTSYVQGITTCYSELSKFPDLKPSPKINDTFERLVSICVQTPIESVTAKVHCPLSIVYGSLSLMEVRFCRVRESQL